MSAKSSVTYLGHMGDDLFVVNRAKTSFDRQSSWAVADCRTFATDAAFDAFAKAVMGYPPTSNGGSVTARYLSDRDKNLVRFLARGTDTADHKALMQMMVACDSEAEARFLFGKIRKIATHFKPFTHPTISLHIEAPKDVYNQLRTHEIGLTVSSVSYRYIEPDSYYLPDVFRSQGENVKQGSGAPCVDQHDVSAIYNESCIRSFEDYRYLTKEGGMCREQARGVLPGATMTCWDWTGSLYAFSRVVNQRLDAHAQPETGEVASMIDSIIRPLFPFCWPVLLGEDV